MVWILTPVIVKYYSITNSKMIGCHVNHHLLKYLGWWDVYSCVTESSTSQVVCEQNENTDKLERERESRSNSDDFNL